MDRIITSLPFVITSGGSWRLGADMDAWACPGAAITSLVPDVDLFGNGHWLINSAGPQAQGVAFFAENVSRIRVHGLNCFGAGWRHNVHLKSTDGFASGGHVVERNKLSANFRAVRVEGSDNMVLDNLIRDVGGAAWGADLYCFGVEVYGPDAIVRQNTILEVNGAGESVGVSLTAGAHRALVDGNIIKNKVRLPRSMAVWVGADQSGVRITGNQFIGYKRCLFGAASSGLADGNRDENCGPLPGEDAHDLYDIPGADDWTGSNMGA